MKDRYGRTIDYMRISITDRCNLRCRYCMPDGIPLVPMQNILTYEEIETICLVAAEAGIHKLKITGGEPLVRHGCAGLVGRLKKIAGIEQVTLTTNGLLLDRYLPKLLDNGLDAVNISLDTLKPNTYQMITGKDKLANVLANIKQAAETGLQVKINTVLQPGVNDAEWLELSKLTEQLPIDVRYIEMMPIGCGKNYNPVSNNDLLENLKTLYPDIKMDEKVHGNGPAVYYQIPGAMGCIGFISAMHGKFCKSCNRLRLSSQGYLKPCLCYEEGEDLKRIVRNSDGTDVKKRLRKAFADVLQKKPQEHQFEHLREITEKKQMVQIGG